MNSLWQEHLSKAGALVENGRVAHFGNPKTELEAAGGATVLADLSHLGLIRAAGEDAQTFLQGQFTNDTRQVTLEKAQYSALCTPKGRMLANLLIWRDDRGFLLQLPAILREDIQQRLTRYLLRAKARLSDGSNELIRMGIAGNAAATILQQAVGPLPQASMGVIHHARATVIRLGDARFEVVASAEAAPGLWNDLARSCTPAGATAWEWLEIRAGVPSILPATQEQFVPQMANMEVLGGVSFQKGCYTGQEVVARTQHLGKVKRRMYLAHVSGGTAPQPGDELLGKETPDTERQSAGAVVNAQPSPDGGFDLLAVIHISSVEAGEIRWKTPDGPVLEFLPLPYPI
jgi:folate-binding protein YgfZ